LSVYLLFHILYWPKHFEELFVVLLFYTNSIIDNGELNLIISQ
jgi:hypothetical protein